MPHAFNAFVLGLTSVALAACSSSSPVSTVCPSDLRFEVTPSTRTVRVGEQFTAHATAFGCAGTERLSDAWVWHALDTTVVRVDSLAGTISGRAVGSTLVFPTGRQYGRGQAVQVTVTP